MKDYLTLIICTSLFCGIIKILLPNTGTGISFTVKIVALCVLLSPLMRWTGATIKTDFEVITEESLHSFDNEEADMVWKRWLAKTTSLELSNDIQTRIHDEFGISARVEVPWYEEGGNIFFDKIRIVAECTDEKLKKINDFVKLHYSLESVCEKEKRE